MKRQRQIWGEFTVQPDDEVVAKQIEIDREIMIEKRGELKILHSSVFFEQKNQKIKLLSKNQTVNQIIGLKQKQEMIEELIETSSADQYGFNQLVPTLKESLEVIPSNPSEIPIPNHNEKFNKLCFIPSNSTEFTAGKPKEIQKVNKNCVEKAIKKSICGLTRLTDYTETTNSALTMFSDAVDHFLKSLIESIITVLTNDDRETETEVDLMTFERAYFALTGDSATSFFNYFKKEIHDKHQETVTEFTQKVTELKNICDSHQPIMQQADFYQSFFVKEEIKQEYDDEV